MDFPVEKILHTILLGTVTLCLIILLTFLLIGFKNNFLKIIFYKRGLSGKSNIKIEGSFTSWLTGTLVFAVIYALGITVENYSDESYDEDYHKAVAFYKNFSKQDNYPVLQETAIQIKEIIDIYKGCGCDAEKTTVRLMKQKRYSFQKFVHNMGITQCYKQTNPLLYNRFAILFENNVKKIYYKAKNEVYKESNYFNELQGIQTRITLTRSLRELFRILTISSFFILSLNVFVHLLQIIVFKKNFNQIWLIHNHNLSKTKIFLLLIISLTVFFIIRDTWENEEKEFNKRVFGYYIDSENSPSKIADLNKNLNPIKEIRSGIFKSNSNSLFEPSGIARINNSNQFLIINDKDSLNLNQFDLFTTKTETDFYLSEQKIIKTNEILYKLEAITQGFSGDQAFYAITSFSRNDKNNNNKLIKFCLDEHNRFHNLKSFSTKRMKKQILELESLKRTKINIRRNLNHIKIEGLTQFDNSSLLIAVREIGKKYNNFKYTCKVYKYDLLTSDIEKWAAFETTNKFEGISDIFFLPKEKNINKNELYILTSIEKEKYINSKNEVAGFLYKLEEFSNSNEKNHISYFNEIKKISLSLKPFRVKSFLKKPEGITMFDKNKAIIVFDSDENRKEKNNPLKFNLESNEDYYMIIEIK